MLTILIVDDELPAIEAIAQRVDWERLNIGRALVADSAAAARTIFFRERIDLMLCDIEMPGESGLELLAWVNQCSRQTVSIFLTCHADFTYAKQAVHMGAFDYLLKPALIEDIEEVVGRAAKEFLHRQSQIEMEQQWQQDKATLEQQVWIHYMRGGFNMSWESLKKELEKRAVFIDENQLFLPMICSVRRWIAPESDRDFEALEYAWFNLLTELFSFNGHPPVVISESIGRKVVLMPGCYPKSVKSARISFVYWINFLWGARNFIGAAPVFMWAAASRCPAFRKFTHNWCGWSRKMFPMTARFFIWTMKRMPAGII